MYNQPLALNVEMKKSWLIQRLRKPLVISGKEIGNPFAFGGGLKNGGLSNEAMKLLQDIFSFDYMGSAEFEFGAVPAAIQFLAKQSVEHNILTGQLTFGKGQTVFYICPKPYEEFVKKLIHDLKTMTPYVQLKEGCGLKNYFESDHEYHKRTVGWLELDNGFAFFVDQGMFNKFCKLLGVAITKRK